MIDQIGPYRIISKVGEGGMGEVYRARDTRLNRDVALKILPEALGHDADPLVRFRREAQVLASLNHVNIATIHGLEETPSTSSGQAGVRALVMEFVEGRTLAEMIASSAAGQGSAAGRLTLAEVLPIARQIADALEAAHEHGIIHRDLKPANIMVRRDGVVKVLDFGLAKALESVPMEAMAGSGARAVETVTSPAVTQAGTILGTAAYMSPEQARGGLVDKRSDIWAFGVVLYELVTGRRLFQGKNVTDVLAAVVRDSPDLADAPPQVRRLLEKCLEKDPRRRLRDISGAALLLDDAASVPPATPVAVAASWKSSWKTRVAFGVVVTALVAAAVALTAILARRGASGTQAVEFAIEPPPGTTFANVHTGSAASPDGQFIVFSAAAAGRPPSLWLRRLGTIDAEMLPGTERGTAPVWSPDGKSIAFMADRKLKRFDLGGGPAVTLADVPRADPNQPGAWNRDGVILFGCPCGLDSVPASGGTVTPLRKVDPAIKETAYAAPQFLPDGNRFIYFVASTDPKVRGVYASSLADPAARTLIMNTSSKAVYVRGQGRAAGGYLLWMEEQTLQARGFDAETLGWQGAPISIAEGVGVEVIQGTTLERAAFWTSDAGLLLYVLAPAAEVKRPLVWMSNTGEPLGDAAPEGPYGAVAISPDGKRVALTRTGVRFTPEENGDIWAWDFERQTNTRVTFGATTDENPVWSRDGKYVAYSSERDGFYQIFRKDASGAGEEERLTNMPKHNDPLDWSPDGRYIVYREMNRGTGWDLMLLPLAGERTPITLLQTPESDSDARFSPDGKWLAYHSRMNGKTIEVFVQAFSGDGTIGLTGTRVQISSGGAQPFWRRDGREVYFNNVPAPATATSIMAATIQFGPPLQVGQPRELFKADFLAERLHTRDVSADQKFLMVLNSRQKPEPPRVTVVTNWQARATK